MRAFVTRMPASSSLDWNRARAMTAWTRTDDSRSRVRFPRPSRNSSNKSSLRFSQ
jgi:hypothetical protein